MIKPASKLLIPNCTIFQNKTLSLAGIIAALIIKRFHRRNEGAFDAFGSKIAWIQMTLSGLDKADR